MHLAHPWEGDDYHSTAVQGTGTPGLLGDRAWARCDACLDKNHPSPGIGQGLLSVGYTCSAASSQTRLGITLGKDANILSAQKPPSWACVPAPRLTPLPTSLARLPHACFPCVLRIYQILGVLCLLFSLPGKFPCGWHLFLFHVSARCHLCRHHP